MNIRKVWKEFVGILLILVWAAFGNAVYDDQNWFFLNDVLFPFIPVEYMPFAVVASVFGVCLVIYGAYFGIVAFTEKKKAVCP